MLFLRATLFYLGQILSTLCFAPVILSLLPCPFSTRYAVISRWSKFNIWWLEICCGVKYQIKGLENIPEKPGIVMSKHQSAWETLMLQLLFMPQVGVLKRELLSIPIYGWGLALLKPIAIDRKNHLKALRQIVHHGCEKLKQGLWVIIFPEGTRVGVNKRLPYLPGGGLLAEKSQAAITPVAHNAGYLWPRNSFIKKPGTITLVIGPCIATEGKRVKQIMAEVEQWIETTAQRLPNPQDQNTTVV